MWEDGKFILHCGITKAIKTITLQIIQGVSHIVHIYTVQFNHDFYHQVTWMGLCIPIIVLIDLIVLPEKHC